MGFWVWGFGVWALGFWDQGLLAYDVNTAYRLDGLSSTCQTVGLGNSYLLAGPLRLPFFAFASGDAPVCFFFGFFDGFTGAFTEIFLFLEVCLAGAEGLVFFTAFFTGCFGFGRMDSPL